MEENNVLILTLYDYCNYGTVLQAYALKAYIESLGIKVDLIKYKSPKKIKDKIYDFAVEMHHLLFSLKKGTKYYYRKKYKSKLKLRTDKFAEFKKMYIEGNNHIVYNSDNIGSLDGKYSIYLIGSDQTWNPSLSTFNVNYLLDFVKSGIKASYAPSIGISELSNEQGKIFKDYLKDFDHISCREITGVNILKKYIDKEIYHVLDPTLLIKAGQWSVINKKKNTYDEPYILEYFLGEDKVQREIVKEIAEKTHYKVINIGICDIDLITNSTNFVAGPEEFIDLIKHAAIVFTDSFHGTAFSINLHTDFYVFYKKDDKGGVVEPSRIKDFLNMFGLQKRIISNINDIDLDDNIDFIAIDNILEKKRKESQKYLDLVLGLGEAHE